MRSDRAKHKLRARESVIGAESKLPEPALVELSAYAGFDSAFDTEHGAIGTRSLVDMIRDAEIHDVTSVMRVPRNAPDAVLRVLDMGVQGIITGSNNEGRC